VIFLTNAGFSRVSIGGPCPGGARSVGNDVYGAWVGPPLPVRFLYWRLPRIVGSIGTRLRRVDQERRVCAVVDGLRHCATVVCNSSYTRDRLRLEGVPETKLEVAVGGVDVGRFSPRDASCPASGASLVVGTAGALKPIKGFTVAIEALRALSPRWPRLSLAIAGDGPERRSLETLAASLGVGSRVIFRGNVTLVAMPEFYRSLDVYVQP